MVAQMGNMVILHIGNGGAPESFTPVGGMMANTLSLNNDTIEFSHRESGSWKGVLPQAGLQSLTLSGNGIFTNSATEATVRQQAFANAIKNYRLNFGNGDIVSGPFQISRYERSGEVNGEELYTLSLNSAGTITYTPAP
jgi:TP901-1 family phage major tail protein